MIRKSPWLVRPGVYFCLLSGQSLCLCSFCFIFSRCFFYFGSILFSKVEYRVLGSESWNLSGVSISEFLKLEIVLKMVCVKSMESMRDEKWLMWVERRNRKGKWVGKGTVEGSNLSAHR